MPQRCDLGTGARGGGAATRVPRDRAAGCTPAVQAADPSLAVPRCFSALCDPAVPARLLTSGWCRAPRRPLLCERNAARSVGVPYVGCAERRRRGAHQHGPSGGCSRDGAGCGWGPCRPPNAVAVLAGRKLFGGSMLWAAAMLFPSAGWSVAQPRAGTAKLS